MYVRLGIASLPRLFTSMSAMVGAGMIACASSPKAPAPQVKLEPPLVQVDFSAIFGGRSSRSIYDPRVTQSGLMDRVMVEPSLLAKDDAKEGVEGWTRRKLLQALGQKGALVVTSGPRVQERPTAVLRNIRFVSGKDDVRVRLERGEGPGTFRVLLRNAHDEPSLCPRALSLAMGFVILRGQVQRVKDGAIGADFQELVLLQPPSETTVKARLPQGAALCKAIVQLYEETPGLARSNPRYERAAKDALTALEPLFAKSKERVSLRRAP